MKKELVELEARLKALRATMTEWQCFQEDDDVDQALSAVEAELENIKENLF